MAMNMTPTNNGSQGPRPSLLQRLQQTTDGEAHERGWQEFYHIYGGLIRSFYMKHGLSPEEA